MVTPYKISCTNIRLKYLFYENLIHVLSLGGRYYLPLSINNQIPNILNTFTIIFYKNLLKTCHS